MFDVTRRDRRFGGVGDGSDQAQSGTVHEDYLQTGSFRSDSCHVHYILLTCETHGYKEFIDIRGVHSISN